MKKEFKKSRYYDDNYYQDNNENTHLNTDARKNRKRVKSNLKHLVDTGYNIDNEDDQDDFILEEIDARKTI